jgi:putative NIF3 family GTP cyclohydrolase 1 type 2
MIGEFQEPINTVELLKRIKEVFGGVVRYTAINKDTIKRVALCGGSGSFLLKDAIRSRAELFLSADFKYHQFFDSEDKIIIADIGHFESEQFTMELIHRYLNQNISNFAGCLTTISTNPIHYL